MRQGSDPPPRGLQPAVTLREGPFKPRRLPLFVTGRSRRQNDASDQTEPRCKLHYGFGVMPPSSCADMSLVFQASFPTAFGTGFA